MLDIQLSKVSILPLILITTVDASSFKVSFQLSDSWSSKEWMRYTGQIRQLSDFTVCHWEKLRYFSSGGATSWGYCFISPEKTFHCLGVYSTGIRSSANRKLKIRIWLEGWTSTAISDGLEINDYRHRSWNHICWSYSSTTLANKLYWNGNVVGNFNTLLPNQSMVRYPIQDSLESSKSALIVGQDQDMIAGGYDSADSLNGEISELNMWSPALKDTDIALKARCENFDRGNIISWRKKLWDINEARVDVLDNPTVLCAEMESLVIFPQPTSIVHATYVCEVHGGSLLAPQSHEENLQMENILLLHKKVCMGKKSGDLANEGKSAWLGLERKGYEWYYSNDGPSLSTSNYSRFVQNGVQGTKGCAFMNHDGSWGSTFSQSLCATLQLCYVCVVRGTPVFTMKGLCESGTPLDWNYYMFINSTGQLEYFDGYKRASKLVSSGESWGARSSGSSISLSLQTNPIGRLEWDWQENACNVLEFQKRELTLSRCNFGEEFTCDSGYCILLKNRCNGRKDCRDGSDENNCNLVVIPKSYRKMKPPKQDMQDGTPIFLELNVYSIDSIDSVNMHVGLTLEVTMKWYDDRIQFRNLFPGQKHRLNSEVVQDLWNPFDKLVFENAIIGKTLKAEYFEVFVVAARNSTISFKSLSPYRSLEDIWFDGKTNMLESTKRLKLEYFCVFLLLQFPFDNQKCDLKLNLKNTKNSNVFFSEDMSKYSYSGPEDVHQFHISNLSSHTVHRDQLDNATNWDNSFIFSIELNRDYKDQVFGMFLPEMMLWFIAYITIFLNINDIANRSRITVTILLVLVALIDSVKHKIPHTPYFKYVDIWSMWYLANIFLITCFHVFMESCCRVEEDTADMNNVCPLDPMSLMMKYDGGNKKWLCNNRIRINRFAALCFPFATVVFNFVYFFLSIY